MNIDKFLQIEAEYDLYHKQIEGRSYWMYARMSLWNYQFCKAKLGLEKSHEYEEPKRIDKLIQGWKRLGYIMHPHHGKTKNRNICFVSSPRRISNGTHFECIYTDVLAKEFEDCVTIEAQYEKKHLQPVATEHIIYTDYVELISEWYIYYYRLIRKLKTKYYKSVMSEIEQQMSEPLDKMIEAYQLNIDKVNIYHTLAYTFFLSKIQYKLYAKMIKRIHPKLMIELAHFSTFKMMLNEICHEMNIPVIELQHGTMHTEHAGYHYGTKTLLPQLPDKILLFSDFWKKMIQMPIADENFITVGYPYFERMQKKYSAVSKQYGDKKVILFISQGTIGTQLSKVAVEISEKLPSEQYHIIFKLHPGEYSIWETRYPWLKNGKIEVVASRERNLYEYLAISDVQVGVYSTAVYEGLGFGLQTFIYDAPHANTMQYLIDEGYAELVKSSDELVAGIWQKTEKTKEGNDFWKSDALKNMITEIRKLQSKT